MSRLSLKSLLIIFVFLLIPIVLLLRIRQNPNPAAAGWFNDSWQYRQRLDITNPSATNLTDFQVNISVGTSALIAAGKLQSTCADIRVTDNQGKVLPHWIEENNPGCNQLTDTKIWVKVPSLPSSGAAIFLYYGNPSATSNQDVNNVFDLYDDFNNNQIDTNKWTYTDTSPITTSESNGVLNRGGSGPASFSVNTFTSKNTFSNYRILESKVRINTCTAGEALLDLRTSVGDFTLRKSYATPVKWENYTGSWNDIAASAISVGGTFVNVKLIDEATGSSIYENDTLLGKKNTAISPGTSTIKLPTRFYMAAGETCSIDLDNVRVRKYASSEPTATAATEEIGTAPIAYWKFDEGVGTSVFDSTSNKNNGIFGAGTSIPTWVPEDQCISGKCLYFNGSTSYLELISPTIVPIGSTSFTIESWFKTSKNTGPGSIFGQYNSLGHTSHYFRVLNGHIGADEYPPSGGSIDSNKTISDSLWHHVVYLYSDTTWSIYIDGIRDISGTSEVYNGTAPTKAWIGNRYGASGNYTFSGYLDELKMYKYARTAAQIQQDYNAGKAHAAAAKGAAANLGSNAKNTDALSNGLIGYWKFDENVGASSADSSGNNNTTIFGSGTSAPVWAPGKYGVGLSFNNTGTYTSAPVNGTALTELTYSFYFNIGTTSSYAGIMQWATALSSGSPAIYVRRNGSSIDLYNSGAYSTPIAITPNTWHLFTATYKNSVASIYIDGNLAMTFNRQLTSTYLNNATILYFGNGYNGYFDGLLDEIRLYNRALSPTEVSQLYNSAPGPVGYWDFDEGTGTTAFDSSGNNLNAGWQGTLGNQWANGKYGKAGNFNGTNNYTIITNQPLLENAPAMTASFWFKPNSFSLNDYSGLIGKTDRTNGWQIIHSWGGRGLYFENFVNGSNTGNKFNTSTQFQDNTWYYVTLTGSNKNMTFYVNGRQDTSLTMTDNLIQSSNDIWIGRSRASGPYFNGIIDDVKIYNYIRTQKQIIEDMNAGHPAGGSPIGSQYAYYKFDEGFGTATQNAGNGGIGITAVFGPGSSAPTWTNDGKFNKALSFNGSSYVNLSNAAFANVIDDSLDYTLSAWIKPTALTTNQTIIGTQYSNGMTFVLVGSQLVHDMDDAALTSNTNLSPNTWYHVVATYKGSDGSHISTLYINGQKDKSAANFNHTITGASELYIGRESRFNYNFSGLIDEVKIYNYVLTEAEVALDYNRGTTLQLGSLSTNTGNTAPSTAGSQEYCIPGDNATCSPPIARWDFEEGAGTTAFDTSGNGNHGPLLGATWTNGKVGKALNFSGTNQYVGITDPGTSSLDITGNLTAEAWVKWRQFKNYGVILQKGNGGASSSFNYALWSYNNQIAAYIANGTSGNGTTYTTLPSLNVWHHLAMTADGSLLKLFIDGALVAQSTQTVTPTPNNYPFTISEYNYTPNAIIDQVRIFSYARTPAQIAYDYNKGAPVGWWKLDDCQGSTAYDASGIGNTGNISVGPSGTQTSLGTCSIGGTTAWGVGASGKNNASLSFDGVDDYAQIADQSYFRNSSQSYSVWFKSSVIPATFGGIFTHTNSNDGYNILQTSNGKVRAYRKISGTWRYVESLTNITNNSWHHLVATYNNNIIIFYVDGVFQGTDTDPSATVFNNSNIILGNYSGNYFSGQLDDVRIYSYALTPNQVSTLYNGGAVNFR